MAASPAEEEEDLMDLPYDLAETVRAVNNIRKLHRQHSDFARTLRRARTTSEGGASLLSEPRTPAYTEVHHPFSLQGQQNLPTLPDGEGSPLLRSANSQSKGAAEGQTPVGAVQCSVIYIGPGTGAASEESSPPRHDVGGSDDNSDRPSYLKSLSEPGEKAKPM